MLPKFPFEVYKIGHKSWTSESRLPPEEYLCKECGKECGHKANLITYEKIKNEEFYLITFKVIAMGAGIYIHEYEYNGTGDYDYNRVYTGIEEMPIDEDLYHNKEEALAIIESRNQKLKKGKDPYE